MEQTEGQKLAPPNLSILTQFQKKPGSKDPSASILMTESATKRAPSFSNQDDTIHTLPSQEEQRSELNDPKTAPSFDVRLERDNNVVMTTKELNPGLLTRFAPSFNANVLSSLISKYIQEEEVQEHKLLKPKNYETFTIDQLNEGKYALTDDFGDFSSSPSRSRSPPQRLQNAKKLIEKSSSKGSLGDQKKMTPQEFGEYYRKSVKDPQEKKNLWLRKQLEEKLRYEMENLTWKPKITEHSKTGPLKHPFLERQNYYDEKKSRELERLRKETAEKKEEQVKQASLPFRPSKKRENQRTESSYLQTDYSLDEASVPRRKHQRRDYNLLGQGTECVFKPKLTSNTHKISEKIKNETHPEVLERLKIMQEKQENELERLRREYAPAFAPTLNPKTIELAKNRKRRQLSESLNKENKVIAAPVEERAQNKKRFRKRRNKKSSGLKEVNLNTERSNEEENTAFGGARRFKFSGEKDDESYKKFKMENALDALKEAARILNKQDYERVKTSVTNSKKENFNRLISQKEQSFMLTEEDEDAETMKLRSRVEGMQKNLAVFQDSFKKIMKEQEKVARSYFEMDNKEQTHQRNLNTGGSSTVPHYKADRSTLPKQRLPHFGTLANSKRSSAEIEEHTNKMMDRNSSLQRSLNARGSRQNSGSIGKDHTRRSQGNKSQESVSNQLGDQPDLFTKTLDDRHDRALYEKLAFSTFQEPSKISGRRSYRDEFEDKQVFGKNHFKGKQNQSAYGSLGQREAKSQARKSNESINTLEVIAQLEKLKQQLLKSELEKTYPGRHKKGRMSLNDPRRIQSKQYVSRKTMMPNIAKFNYEDRESSSSESRRSVSQRKSIREDIKPTNKGLRRSVEDKSIRHFNQKSKGSFEVNNPSNRSLYYEFDYSTQNPDYSGTQRGNLSGRDTYRNTNHAVRKDLHGKPSNRMSLREDSLEHSEELNRRSVAGKLPTKRGVLKQKTIQGEEDTHFRERSRGATYSEETGEKPRTSKAIKKKKSKAVGRSENTHQSKEYEENDDFYAPHNSRKESSGNQEGSESVEVFETEITEEDQLLTDSFVSEESGPQKKKHSHFHRRSQDLAGDINRLSFSGAQLKEGESYRSRRSARSHQRIQERVADLSWSPERENRSPREPHDHVKSRIELMTIMLKYLPENLSLDQEKIQAFYRNCELLYCDTENTDRQSKSPGRGFQTTNF